jgi:precorrin-2 dehydrogenase / sirohydrochlorin ferrochelatase
MVWQVNAMKNKKPKSYPYYPAFLRIHKKKCVVVGGGRVALRKIRMLLDCGGEVKVVSSTFHSNLLRLAEKKAIRLIRRDYKPGDLTGAAMVIAATDRQEINRSVAEEAKRVGALANVVDDPEPSSFILPSYFRRGGLTLAVSTGGKSPALARKIKTELQKDFGKEYAALLLLIAEVRSSLKRRGVRINAGRWQKALDLEPLLRWLRVGKPERAKQILLDKLAGHDSIPSVKT